MKTYDLAQTAELIEAMRGKRMTVPSYLPFFVACVAAR